MTFLLRGGSASKGVAIGNVSVVERGQFEVEEYRIGPRMVEREVARFERALEQARQQLRDIHDQLPPPAAAEVAAFIDVHRLMLQDSTLSKTPIDLIRQTRCNAEWALKRQRDVLVGVFESMEDPYLRSRKEDVNHVVHRIQWILGDDGSRRRPAADRRLAGRIVFAEDLTPADVVLMQHQGIAAFLTDFGGPNSHTAILARSLRIPAVVGLHHARAYLREDDFVVVDGRLGAVIVNADEAIVRHYRRRQRDFARFHAARQKLRRAPVVTGDGERVVLQANVELPADVQAASRVSADGIGLYRTETLFMNRTEPPGEEEQYETYVEAVEALKGSPVTIRSVDLGADKQVDGGRPGAPATSNPALGLRAVRLCLRDPALFRPQVRAILRAAAAGPVRMMIPMLSNMQELLQVLQIVEECRHELRRRKVEFDPTMPLGAMVEVPAVALSADSFARRLDFFSIGTNDLIQYTIAVDRVDDEVNYLFDPLHPAVLRLIQMTIRAGRKAGIPVAMCGEMAGDARYTRLLLGMGLKEFSVHPNALLEIKQIITGSHIGKLKKQCQRVLRVTNAATRIALIDEINRPGGPR